MRKMRFFQKSQKSVISEIQVFFLSRLDGFVSSLLQFDKKTAINTLIFFKKMILFIFEPKNREMIKKLFQGTAQRNWIF